MGVVTRRKSNDPWGSIYQRSGTRVKDDLAASDRRIADHYEEGSTRLLEAILRSR